MNLAKFFRNGQAAQAAINELGHGAPAGAKGHEVARDTIQKLDGRFIGDEINTTIQACVEVIAAVTNQRPRFASMQDSERRLAADSLEQLGKCAYALAAHLRGGTR